MTTTSRRGKIAPRFTSIHALTALWLLCGSSQGANAQHGLRGPYIDPAYLTAAPFGAHSHWLQPWRAYQETVPAKRFLEAQGIVLDSLPGVHYDLICRMLARCGIRHARIEIGWNMVNWEDETLLNSPDDVQKRLAACQKYGIRPLILLNANSGAPGPVRFFDRVLAAPAHKGARQVELTDTDGLVAGYSGFRNLTDNRASEVLITGVKGRLLTLSKPLPKDLGDAGAHVGMTTLKYRPFGPPNTPEYQATLEAWQRYVATVAKRVTAVLGTAGKSDKGFDIEIWNELSFGSSFLTLNSYYEPKFADYDEFGVFGRLVKATTDVAEAHPDQFQGVRFVDGFRNTIPWPAASTEPVRVSAMSSHPYPPRKTYPADDQQGKRIDALGSEDTSGFVPTYSVNFPEYFGTLLQTETVLRDMGPIANAVGGTMHGRNSRVVNGKVAPCPLWFTEIGFAPDENGIKNRDAALAIKAKTAARFECFSINKGLERLYFFSALSGDVSLGVVQDNFVTYAKTHSDYPADDAPYLSPILRVIQRLVAAMRSGMDPSLTRTRVITVASITDTHNHLQFTGDGSAAHPPLYNREVLAILPFQVNSRKFVIPYYVMTRDITKPLPPEKYTIRLSGVRGNRATVSAVDSLSGKSIPVHTASADSNTLTVTLTATDDPALLTVQER